MPPVDDADLASTLAVVAQALATEKDLTAVVLRTCQLAVETIEPAQHADVMVVGPGGGLSVPAATDWVGIRVVSFEEELGEGPCIDAYNTAALVDAPDMEAEQRWPRFTPRCVAETPVRSGLGLPLMVGTRCVGALDLYADAANAFGAEERGAAALFAAHAAIAFGAARERVDFARALESRDVIGQAKGILMAQSHVSADEAFDLLRRASQRVNRKLVVVAQEIIDRSAK